MPKTITNFIGLMIIVALTLMPCRPLIAAEESDMQPEMTYVNSQELSNQINESGDDQIEQDQEYDDESDELDEVVILNSDLKDRIIRSVEIIGNRFTPEQAILVHIPYAVGDLFDPSKSGFLINNIYNHLDHFNGIELRAKPVGNDSVNLYIIVNEKPSVKDVVLVGNKKISLADVKKKVDLDSLSFVDEAALTVIGHKIKKLYREKGYTQANIESSLEIDVADGKASLLLTVHEGLQSLVKEIKIVGNEVISSKELRTAMFTKEDWLLSFLDGSGTFHPDRLEGDKYMIEQCYQNRGYIQAHVADADVSIEPCSKNITITFAVDEGDCFTVEKVEIFKNELNIPEAALLAGIPVQVGDIFSREKVADSVRALETLCGDFGYIFAQVTPIPQIDDSKKIVSISFSIQLGDRILLNRVTIRGNRKTRDKVIRRELLVQEGYLLSARSMDLSKQNVEALGYFEPRDGVNWKIHRIGPGEVDLDLVVREARTGSMNMQAGFGGTDLRSPTTGLSVKGLVSDRNLFGKGINFSLEGSWAQEEQTAVFHIAQPWLFDKPITGAFNVYHRRPTYDELRNVFPQAINEKLTGFGFSGGFITPPDMPICAGAHLVASLGIDSVHYENPPIANISGAGLVANGVYQQILNKEFAKGRFLWVSYELGQDRLNNPMHASRGHKWKLFSRFAAPSFGDLIGFYKFTFDYHWYTALIGDYDLVFHFHTFFGWASPFKGKAIPFGELFHIGGQSSVRGFLFGQIGPRFYGDSIGASKTMFWNAELIFPITPDLNMSGVAFYDGGAGWSNPYSDTVGTVPGLSNNGFDYRHSVGLGLRLLNPTPVKVDIGFKLDARHNRFNPRDSETGYEIHFGMNYGW